jgi:prepilin-type N-terminal cleavage/methylation domain-containing protein
MKFYGPLRRFPQPLRRLRRLRGFTLVELMVVVAIAAILALIAAPSFTETINRTRRKTYANQLFEDLAFARSEAIKRGVPVTVCPSTDGANCMALSADGQAGVSVRSARPVCRQLKTSKVVRLLISRLFKQAAD